MVQISIGNGGLDILFISEFLPKGGQWHAFGYINIFMEREMACDKPVFSEKWIIENPIFVDIYLGPG
jgi:hypothetical protein